MDDERTYLRCFNSGQWLAYCEAERRYLRLRKECREALRRKNSILYASIKGRPHRLGEGPFTQTPGGHT